MTYVHYINYGNGRYYDTPLHYIVDNSIVGTAAPVAVSVPQTAGFYEKPIISYVNAGQKPSLYVQQQFPYIKLGNDHVAGQGVYVVSRKPLAPSYVPVSNEKLVVEVENGNQGHTDEKSKKEGDNKKKEYNDEHKNDDEDDDDEDDDDETTVDITMLMKLIIPRFHRKDSSMFI